MKPKDFQQATADRIVQVFRGGQNRVLLADEVGLGKTIVAREVVRQVAQWHKEEQGDVPFRVVYICSNVNIASQNASKLGIQNQLKVSESRLSMQHLKLYQSAGRGHDDTQLIPLTPGTSFTMTSGCGSQEERALMYAHLRRLPAFRAYSRQLQNFLAYRAEKDWRNYVDYYEGLVAQCGKNGSGYLKDMAKELTRRLAREAGLTARIVRCCRSRLGGWREEQRTLINQLRRIFAEISLSRLKPHLVIMDEFQRFRDLIDPEDDSEEALLARQFLSGGQTKVLLLSATPYKPYATLEEIAQDQKAEHYGEFMQVMNFLFYEPWKREQFHTVWQQYSHALCEISGEKLTVLMTRKAAAEEQLYQGICRTERFNTGILDDSGVREVPVSQGDILSFDAMQSLLDQIAAQGKGLSRFRNVPMEYVKSSPYLLSFMENYQLKKQLRAHFTHGFDFAATAGRSASHLLLKRSAIQNYRPIPFEHAKLEQLANVAFHQDREGAENLLWVPPSNPYYNTKGVFSKHGNYSKVLVFSSWEMVPRMIAVMLSYEAERRTIGKLYHDPSLKWGRGYFATKEERRYGVARLREESEAIVTLPSPILAKCYCPEEYLGRDIAYVRREVGKQIRVRLETLRKERKLPVRGRASAQSLGACIQALDGAQEGTPLSAIPTDAVEILTDIAIASPAVCAYRLLRRTWQSAGTFQVQKIAGEIAGLFVSLFNKPESAAILDLLYGRKSDDAYYQTVFRYCVEGNLQAVLDEYAHVLAVPGAELEQAMMDGFIDTATLQIDTRESFPDQEKNRARMRTHFAVGYFSAKRDEEHATHTDNIRRAFNSPFRPFVLATTSIGQEGLDFHAYCRKVVHWNLPSNPIDLEQREGRVNRYKCLAVRQNIAQQYGGEFDWERMFERAGREKKGNFSDLVPFWCLPTKEGQPRIPIERIVPLYPLSRDKLRYQRLIKVLSLYRLTLGQPRQEELLAVLDQELTEQDSKKLFMDLSPYDRERSQEEQ